MIRKTIRYLIVTFAIIFCGLTCLLILSSKPQIEKNQKLLADMNDRITAIKKFERLNSRLPNKHEINDVLHGLPIRYTAYDYTFATTPHEVPIDTSLTNWPSTGGWALFYWRGEWFEYYTSWNDYDSLTEQASWWGFCGWLLISPFVGVAIFFLSKLPILRTNKPAL